MNFTDDYEYTSEYNALFLAVHNGDEALIRSLLKNRKYSVHEVISRRTLFHVAAARGYSDIFPILIKEGFRSIIRLLITKRDINGNTPLHLAIKNNHLEIFTALLESCDINAKNFWGATPLLLASLHNYFEFAKILIDRGAKVDVSDHHYRRTPLHFACQNGNLSIVQLLMENGSNAFDLKDKEFMTPFGLALKYNNLQIVRYFSENISSIRPLIENDFDLLSTCVKNNNIDVLNYFVNFGVKTMKNLLIESLILGHLEVWKFLLKYSSKIHGFANSQETLLHSAIRGGEFKTVRKYLNKNVNNAIYCNSYAAKLAIYIAVENNREEILKVLLKKGFCVKSPFLDLTPLHVAATFNDTKIVEILLHAGADVNSLTDDCFSPLHFAAVAGQLNNVRVLLEAGADPFVHKLPFTIVLRLLSPPTNSTIFVPERLKIAVMLITHIENPVGLMTSCLEMENILILKMVVAHSAILLINDCKSNERNSKSNSGENWQEDCKRQIMKMRETKVCDDYNVTFYDILMMSVDKLSMYVRHKELLSILESSYLNFPGYAEFLKVNVEEGIERKKLIDNCVNSLCKHVDRNLKIQISSIDIHLVTQYLSVQDLRRLSTAFFIKSS